jgi:hypothetical protein
VFGAEPIGVCVPGSGWAAEGRPAAPAVDGSQPAAGGMTGVAEGDSCAARVPLTRPDHSVPDPDGSDASDVGPATCAPRVERSGRAQSGRDGSGDAVVGPIGASARWGESGRSADCSQAGIDGDATRQPDNDDGAESADTGPGRPARPPATSADTPQPDADSADAETGPPA